VVQETAFLALAALTIAEYSSPNDNLGREGKGREGQEAQPSSLAIL